MFHDKLYQNTLFLSTYQSALTFLLCRISWSQTCLLNSILVHSEIYFVKTRGNRTQWSRENSTPVLANRYIILPQPSSNAVMNRCISGVKKFLSSSGFRTAIMPAMRAPTECVGSTKACVIFNTEYSRRMSKTQTLLQLERSSKYSDEVVNLRRITYSHSAHVRDIRNVMKKYSCRIAG